MPHSGSSCPERILKHYEASSDVRMESNVREGKVVIGKLFVFKRWSTMLRFVCSPLFPVDVVIDSKDYNILNTYDSDIVAVELFPMNEWKEITPRPANTSNPESALTETDFLKAEDDFDQLLTMPKQLPDGRPILHVLPGETPRRNIPMEVELARECGAPDKYEWPHNLSPSGRVVSVLHRDLNACHVGHLSNTVTLPHNYYTLKSDFYYRFQMYDPLLPQFVVRGSDIPTPYHKELDSYLFLLRIESTSDGTVCLLNGDFIKAKIERVLGRANSVEANTMAICETYKVHPECFDDDVEACVPSEFKVAEADELERMGRRDLRNEFALTIDPPTAPDLDDAISIRRTPRGGYHVGVHIADVTHFVQTGTPLDEEAKRRATTVYFVDRSFPMLPRRITNDMCSLNPFEDKYTFSVLFEMNQDGEILEEWFGKSVIQSRCRLTYEQAQMIIDNKEVEINIAKEGSVSSDTERVLKDKVMTSVKLMHALASKLRQRSFKRGRLDISGPKLSFVFEDMNSQNPPIGFYLKKGVDASWLVEEFMLLTNARVAEKIVQYLPERALLRCHPAIDKRGFLQIRDSLANQSTKLKNLGNRSLQDLINKSQGNKNYDAVCKLVVFRMQKAYYIANSFEKGITRSHYALAMPWYTHFTSPIRRYCDIIVHRQLLVALEIERRLSEMHLDLPHTLDTHLKVDPSKEPSANSSLLPLGSLSECDPCYSTSEVADIALHANAASERAREASEASEMLFFCIYLQALTQILKKNNCMPPVHRTIAYVINICRSSIVLYSSEIAVHAEVELRDNKQSFVLLNSEELEKDASDTGNVNQTAGLHKQETDKKNVDSKTNRVLVRLLWSRNSENATETIEEVTFLHSFVVELRVNNTRAMSLDMIVLPPWEREIYEKSGTTIPTSLLQ